MPTLRYRNVYFTPEDDVQTLVETLPDRATSSLAMEIYGLTDLALIDHLVAAADRGVQIRVMNDRSQAAGAADHHALQRLVDAGARTGRIAVKVVESSRGAIDHLKVITIDGDHGALADSSAVLYGSDNFSASAQRQDNVAVLTNDPGEVDRAIRKFDTDWSGNIAKPEWQIAPTETPG